MIVLATMNEMEDVYQLICELEDKRIDQEHFERIYRNGLNNEDVDFYVYQKDDEIVGFISLYVHHYLHHDHDTAEIVELVVSSKYRGQKIGDQLIKHVEIIARKKQLEEIELSTSTYRKKAHRFYEAHGYVKDHYNYRKKLI